MNRMRFKLAGSSRELVHQAIELIEDGWLQEQERRVAERSAVMLDYPTPGWLRPHPQRDLAARIAGQMAASTSLRVGYLPVGECAAHAMARICLRTAAVNPTVLVERDLSAATPEAQRLTRVAAGLAHSALTLHDRALVAKEARVQTREFIEQAGLQVIVIDEPDLPALRNEGLLPELDRWRIRMEFREAVRGTNVMMILPG